MLSFTNMFFHIKGFKILAMKLTVLTFMIKFLFAEDQQVLRRPSQAILEPCDNAPCDNTHCDNVENNSDNNCESHIEVSEEICSHIDQNLNEDH